MYVSMICLAEPKLGRFIVSHYIAMQVHGIYSERMCSEEWCPAGVDAVLCTCSPSLMSFSTPDYYTVDTPSLSCLVMMMDPAT